MSSAASAFTLVPTIPAELSRFEAAFVRTVLEHNGIFRMPTLTEFRTALDLLRKFDEQCLDNPKAGDEWTPDIDDESLAELRAKAFLIFGVTKPTHEQWHRAHAALFGPLLCETCQ